MKTNTMLRGKILKVLCELYPNGIERTSLIGIYHQYEKVEDIERSAQYLIDKGLAEKLNHPHPYKANERVVWYKATADGIDLYEGTKSADPGIIIPIEE